MLAKNWRYRLGDGDFLYESDLFYSMVYPIGGGRFAYKLNALWGKVVAVDVRFDNKGAAMEAAEHKMADLMVKELAKVGVELEEQT